MLRNVVALSCLLLSSFAFSDEIEPKIAVGILTCHFDASSPTSPFSCDRSGLREYSRKISRDADGSWSVVFDSNDTEHRYTASFWISPRRTSQGTMLGANITLNIDGQSVGRAVQIAQKGKPLNSGQLSAATTYVNASTIQVPVLLYSFDGTSLDALYEAISATKPNSR